MGPWCPFCAGSRVDPISEMKFLKNIVNKRCGRLLAEKYINASKKMRAICVRNHAFSVSATSLKSGRWCFKCGHIERGLKRRGAFSKSYMAKFARDRGVYFLSEQYTRSSDLYRWKCRHCDHCWGARFNDIKNGKGCPRCGQERSNRAKMKSLKDAKREALKGGFVLKSGTYLGFHKRHLFVCRFCGERVEKSFVAVSMGLANCPNCFKTKSVGEQLVTVAVEHIFGKQFSKVRPRWLQLGSTARTRLELDLYNEPLKLAFEIQGRQHFQLVQKFHKSKTAFRAQQKRDQLKQKLCREKGVVLIEVPPIPEQLSVDGILDFLGKELKKRGVMFPKVRANREVNYRKKIALFERMELDRYRKILCDSGLELKSKHLPVPGEKLKIRCDCGNDFLRLPVEVKIGRVKSCPICSRQRMGAYQVKSLAARKKEARERGFNLESKAVGGTYDVLRYRCFSGNHVVSKCPSNFRKMTQCTLCSRHKAVIESIIKLATSFGYKLLDERKGSRQVSRKFKCLSCGRVRNTRPDALTNCLKCRKK